MDGKFIDIVFDGPPQPPMPHLVEVEDETGHSINAGEWMQRDDGYWALRIRTPAMVDPEQIEESIRRANIAEAEADRMSANPVVRFSEEGEVDDEYDTPAILYVTAEHLRQLAESLRATETGD